MLSLFAVRAGAQADSIIFLYCDSVRSGCSYTVTEIDESTGKTISSWSDGGSLSVTVDTAFSRLGDASNAFGIKVDTVNKMIRGLTYSKLKLHYLDNPSGVTDGEEVIQVTVDSLPFIEDPGGNIHLSGMYPVHWSFGSFRTYSIHNYSYNGGCEDSGTVLNSISLEISNSTADISTSKATSMPLHSGSDGTNEIFSFDSSPFERTLSVINLLGGTAQSVMISSGAALHQVSLNKLPPGCYFARLDDEVAKFVVPPR